MKVLLLQPIIKEKKQLGWKVSPSSVDDGKFSKGSRSYTFDWITLNPVRITSSPDKQGYIIEDAVIQKYEKVGNKATLTHRSKVTDKEISDTDALLTESVFTDS